MRDCGMSGSSFDTVAAAGGRSVVVMVVVVVDNRRKQRPDQPIENRVDQLMDRHTDDFYGRI